MSIMSKKNQMWYSRGMSKNTTVPSAPVSQTPVSQTPDLEGLREFATETGRVDPPAFVGRGEFIREFQRDIRTRTRKWYDGKPGPWKSGSWLFQGAPGAGKTALLAELQKIIVPNSDGTPTNLNVCMLKKEALNSAVELESELLSLFPDNLLGALIRKIGLKISLLGFGSAEISAEKKAAAEAWRQKVRKAQLNPGKYPPLLVMIDEAQGIEHKARAQLGWLHEGTHGLPILPVFGGLAWTRKHFKAITPVLSRIDDDRALTLEKLPEKDCLDAVRKFLKKFRVVASPQATEEWAQAIAEDCMGWPQHLHVGLHGMARALIAPGVDGNLDRLDETDLIEARQYAEKRRNAYYSDRLASENLKGNRCLSAVAVSCLRSSGDSASRATMQKKIRKVSDEAGGMGADHEFALPEETTPRQYVEGMIHAGILHEDGDGYLSVPIPCFHNYLLEKLEQWEQDRKPPTEPEENPVSSPSF